jgi:hypothetical protein
MTGFDWLTFLRKHGIFYKERGADVARGHVNIHCPFCGSLDPKQHMGLELSTGKWGCWRDKDHRGRKPTRLIRALLGCSWEQAREITGDDAAANPGSLEEIRGRLGAMDAPRPKEKEERRRELMFPPEFKQIRPTGTRRRFFLHLQDRGFPAHDIPALVDRYSLRCCLAGTWRMRIILPVYDGDHLIGWTARAITKSEIRYRAHPEGKVVKRHLFNQQNVRGGKTLVVVEGGFDCLKIDFYGHGHGINSIGLMSTSATDSQLSRIYDIAPSYERLLILLDQGAAKAARDLASSLQIFHPEIGRLPENIKDPGDLPAHLVLPLIQG